MSFSTVAPPSEASHATRRPFALFPGGQERRTQRSRAVQTRPRHRHDSIMEERRAGCQENKGRAKQRPQTRARWMLSPGSRGTPRSLSASLVFVRARLCPSVHPGRGDSTAQISPAFLPFSLLKREKKSPSRPEILEPFSASQAGSSRFSIGRIVPSRANKILTKYPYFVLTFGLRYYMLCLVG